MTAMAMRRSKAAWAARAGGGGFGRAGRFRLGLLGCVRGSLRRFHGRRRRRRRPAAGQRGSDLRYNLRITLEEAFAGSRRPINVPTSVTCEHLQRHRRRKRLRARQPARPVPAWARCARSRASSPSSAPARPVPGAGQIDQEPLQGLRRRRPAREGTRAFGQHSRGRRDRHPHPAGRRRRGRACAAGPSGDLYIFIEVEAHPIFQRDGDQPLLPRAGLDDLGGAGRRDRSADDRRRPQPGENPGGQPVGHPDAPARQGHARAARRCGRRHVHRTGGRNPGQPDLAPEGAAA